MTAQTPGQPSLWALPAQRAHDAFFASIGVEDLIDDWHEDMDDNRRGAWENAMEAAYPSMRDEFVRLSIERNDARAERNQASASYQQVTAENDRLKAAIIALADLWVREADEGDAAKSSLGFDGIATEARQMRRVHAAALRKLAGLEDA